jgi:ABC-type antimicrobial peptide transport system, permease component
MDVDFFAPDAIAGMKGKTIDMQQGVVGGEYFRVMSIPLKAGRLFDQRDTVPGAKTLIVSESLARALWGDADPVGRTAWKDLTVVGVVGDVRHFGPETQFVRTVYRPMAQRQAWGGTLVVMTDREPGQLIPALRQAVREINNSVVFQRAETMGELVASRTAAPRFLAVLLGSFGGAALLLAAIGMYGVISYSVSQRTREIGVRIALGAQPRSVLGMIVRGALRLAGIGVAIGLAGAVALSRFLRAQLFEVSALDPAMYAAAAVVVAAVTLLACYMPARRAAKVDPIIALRYE